MTKAPLRHVPPVQQESRDLSQDLFDHAVKNLQCFWHAHGWRMADAKEMAPCTWADEFFFCLLGGYSITFESNRAAFNMLHKRGMLSRSWFQDQPDAKEQLAAALRSEELRHPDNPGRSLRYRFPNAKSESLVKAADWLEKSIAWDFEALRALSSYDARQVLVSCPGVGYKTASWFLRNVGHGKGLSIIDVHIERVTKSWAIIPYGLTPQRDYLEIEERFVSVCEAACAPIEELDLVLWSYARGDFT